MKAHKHIVPRTQRRQRPWLYPTVNVLQDLSCFALDL